MQSQSTVCILLVPRKHVIYACPMHSREAYNLHVSWTVPKCSHFAHFICSNKIHVMCNAKNMQCSPKIHVVFAGPMQANEHLIYTSYANQDACNVDVSHVVQSRCNIPMPYALYRSVQFIWSLCSPNMHTTYVWPIRSWDACDLHVVHAIPCSLKMCIFFVFPMTS